MYAFQIDRVTHFSLARQNASLCGQYVSNGIEFDGRQGLICPACTHLEHSAWVRDWHRRYGLLGPIKPLATDAAGNDRWFEAEKLVA